MKNIKTKSPRFLGGIHLYRWVSKYREIIPSTILVRIFSNKKIFFRNFIHIPIFAVDNSYLILIIDAIDNVVI